MAGITVIGGLNMGYRFAVTVRANADDLHMIHLQYRTPGNGTVTGLANAGAIDMGNRLAEGNNAVVAAGARTQHLIMIH